MSETGIGRQPITIFEIDQDLCSREYGVAPCIAALGVTGVRKCFKTNATCQDAANYLRGTLTLRFCQPAENLPRDVTLIPSVTAFTTVPTEINIGGGDNSSSPLGRRASVTITLQDHPHHDRGLDPYWAERDYDATAQGTFWTKWLARNPYYQGRALRVLYGYVGQALADMRVRHYIIEKIDGPSNGRVQITAKDPIKLLEVARAQAPFANSGTLKTDIDESALIVELRPAGIGDEEYASSGHARIGSEIVAFTRVGDQVELTARGLFKNPPAAAKAGDLFQQVLYYKARRVDDVLSDLLLTFTEFPSAFIDAAAWAAELEPWSASLTVTALIAEPTGVDKLIGEIIQQTLCYVWWDELSQELRLKALRSRLVQIDSDPVELTAMANVVADRFAIADKPADRVSQVWIYYDKIDPTGGDDEKNYARLRVSADAAAESADQYSEHRVAKIFARWLGSGNDASAHVLAIRKLRAFRDTPKLYTFSLDAKDRAVKAADFARVTHPSVVDFTGAALPIDLQLWSVEEVEPGHRNEYTGRPAITYIANGGFVLPEGAPDYGDATAAEKFMGCWIAPASGVFANGDQPYRII